MMFRPAKAEVSSEPPPVEHESQDDPIFEEQARQIIQDAGLQWAALLEEGYSPVQRVASLLQIATDDQAAAELQTHENFAQAATSALAEFIGRHYESFNQSIGYFTEMIGRVTNARDAIFSIKYKIETMANLMLPYDEQLDEARTRWVKAVVREHVLTELIQCARSERRAAVALKAKNSLGAVRILRRYILKVTRLLHEDLVVLTPLHSLLQQRIAALPTAALTLIFETLFEPPQIVTFAVMEPLELIPILTRSEVEEYARFPSNRDPVQYGLACHVTAMLDAGAAEQLTSAFSSPNTALFKDWVTRFITMYTAACRSGQATQPTSTTVDEFEGDSADTDLVLALRSSTQARHLVVCALQGMSEILRRASYVLFTAAALSQPIIGVLLERGLPLDDPALWPLGEYRISRSDVDDVIRKISATSGASVAQRGADVQNAMQRLSSACSAARLTNNYTLPSLSVTDLCKRIVEERSHLTHSLGAAVVPEALRECSDIMCSAATDVVREHALRAVTTCLGRWTPKPFWLALQPYAVAFVDALTSITQYDGSSNGLSASAKGRAPLPMSAMRVEPQLETLPSLLQSRGSTGAPKFLELMGPVTAKDLVSSAKAAASAGAQRDGGASDVVDISGLRQLVRPSVFHLPAVLPPLFNFAEYSVLKIPGLGVRRPPGGGAASPYDAGSTLIGAFCQRSCYAYSALMKRRWLAKLDRAMSLQVNGARPEDGQTALVCASHVSSDSPILSLALMTDEALTLLLPLRRDAPQIAEDPTLRAADMLVEHLAVFLKARLDGIAGRSFGLSAVKELMDAAFSHAPSAEWDRLISPAAGCRVAQRSLDAAVSAEYKAISDSRASSSALHRGPRSGDTHDFPAMALASQSVVAEIAAIAHSVEWLANRYIRFAHRGLPIDSSSCTVPCGGVQLTGRHPTDAGVAVYQQLSSVAQGALFVIAGDIKLATCQYMADMRDFSYNVPSEGSQANSFVLRMVEAVRRIFAAAAPHLSAAKRRYLAAAAATPASELFVHEVGYLRDKRVTLAGSRQLSLDMQCVEHALLNLCPGDDALADEVSAAMRRTREYFSLLDADHADLVRAIVASGLHEKFNAVELENLIVLCNRGDGGDNAGFEKIEELRQKTGSLDNTSFALGAVLPPSVAGKNLAPRPPTLPSVDASIQELRQIRRTPRTAPLSMRPSVADATPVKNPLADPITPTPLRGTSSAPLPTGTPPAPSVEGRPHHPSTAEGHVSDEAGELEEEEEEQVEESEDVE